MVVQLKIVDIVLNLFWQHLNMNLDENTLSISHRMRENPIDGVDNQKIFLTFFNRGDTLYLNDHMGPCSNPRISFHICQ